MTEAEFAVCYREQLPKIRSYIGARINSADDAEDLAADVFTKALSALSTYQAEQSSFSTWLYTITANTVRDYFRRSSVRNNTITAVEDDVLESLPAEALSLDESLCKQELLEALADALQALPEIQRQIVVLQFYDGLPQKEIAARLGLGDANTRYLSHRAVKAIREDFRRRGFL